MPGGDAMTPLERLLNLVGLLLESPTPLTFDQIQEMLEPYQQPNQDSAKRMFERDKDVLREYGVPVELVDTDPWGAEQGYVIRKEAYYLQEIAFEPDELGALLVAAQSGGADTEAERAVRKLVYGADGGVLAGLAGGPLAAGSDARSALVLAVADAAQRRRRIRFGYRTSQGKEADREVDAFAMVFQGGHWYLVGHDRGRDDVRAFRLSRTTDGPTDIGEGIEPPEGFSAADHVSAGPWDAEAAERARVLFEPQVAWAAANAFPGAEEGDTLPDGRVQVRIPVGDEDALISMLLPYGPDAEVIEPPSLRDGMVRRLEAFLALA